MTARKTHARRKREPAAAPVVEVDFAKMAARIASDNRAEDIVILDLRGLTSIADYFVIATGISDRQLRAIADELEAKGKAVGQKPFQISGYENTAWVLVDFVDVVVHLFDREHRDYYDLELLWGDAPRIDWEPAAKA
ncbi:MAG TPA: ribosome silencing factor [Phycisphaerae bacterium]|nr:ribosome silencing factor [Phycisphaerae bacterium]